MCSARFCWRGTRSGRSMPPTAARRYGGCPVPSSLPACASGGTPRPDRVPRQQKRALARWGRVGGGAGLAVKGVAGVSGEASGYAGRLFGGIGLSHPGVVARLRKRRHIPPRQRPAPPRDAPSPHELARWRREGGVGGIALKAAGGVSGGFFPLCGEAAGRHGSCSIPALTPSCASGDALALAGRVLLVGCVERCEWLFLLRSKE